MQSQRFSRIFPYIGWAEQSVGIVLLLRGLIYSELNEVLIFLFILLFVNTLGTLDIFLRQLYQHIH